MNQKTIEMIGTTAMFLAMGLYLSFIDQIRLNMNGTPGSIIMPIVSILNCVTWSVYGLFKKERDWRIVLPNVAGIILAPTTIATALFCKNGCTF